MISRDKIKLKTDMPIIIYGETDSTSMRAREYLNENPDCERALFVADSQSAGRGRQGKSFYSPKGTGVYLTYMFRAGGAADTVHITTKAAVAVLTALERVTDKRFLIKWVNDIYLEDKKVCGILSEAVSGHILIGVGVNLTTEMFPADISETAGAIHSDCGRNTVISSIVNALCDMDSTEWYELYKKRSLVIGRQIDYTVNGVTSTALAVDIDTNGGLIVKKSDGTYSLLSSGEITVRWKK